MVKRVALAPKLDTAAAEALRKTLNAAQGDDLVIDGSDVEMLGALCLEAILYATALAVKAGHLVRIENASEQMAEDLGWFGLTPETLVECAA